MKLNREGTFRAKIVGHGWAVSRGSQSLGISVTCLCTHQLGGQPEEWKPITDSCPMVDGTVWIVGKDGSPRNQVREMFMLASGWDGSDEQIDGEKPWEALDVEIDVEVDDYQAAKGKEAFRIQWINPLGTSAGKRPVLKSDVEEAKARRARAASGAWRTFTPPIPPPEPPPVVESPEGESIPF